ncbi:transposase [Calycomorphotria hydatis]|uniref:Transposase IS200 like protein n=1 Tax=Calycomorphotria hydatis TaxID=2528027 RepID=A0A517T4D7_9PLAN|nr:Transposase IS200 like protein [Calycomorphotria hydatis]
MYNDPIAYFLTWTTYGTWLSGDGRGWIRDDSSEIQSESLPLQFLSDAMLTEPAFILSKQQRMDIKSAIEERVKYKRWILHAINVRTNHVHVVVSTRETSGKQSMSQLKSWATRRLKQTQQDRQKWWTRGGSARSIFTDSSLESIIHYVLHEQ